MNKHEKRTRVVIIALIVLAAILTAMIVWLLIDRQRRQSKFTESEPAAQNGLFSWHDEVFEEDEREILFSLMRSQGLTELYQDIPHDMPTEKVLELRDACNEAGIRLYSLVGDPGWALDKTASKLHAEIQRAALIGCFGVMSDIEPAETDKWDEDRDEVMECMAEGYINAQAAAELEGLELIVCIPWYFDKIGYSDELEQIISNGCTAAAIMNYLREDEAGQIETEAKLCRRYEKRVINIFELQEVGKHGLLEINTYNEAGLDAVWDSWDHLRSAYAKQETSLALHEYRALKQMCGLE